MKFSVKQTISLLLFFGFLCLQPVSPALAAQVGQEGIPTLAPTLPVELYTYTATPGLDGGIRHVVLEGQFLYNIAELYGVGLQEILTLNNLTEESIIHPGDELVIVRGGETLLGMGTQTPNPGELEATIMLPPTSSPTSDVMSRLILPEEITPEPTPGEQPGFFERVFSHDARFLAFGVIGLVVFGVVLLVISARRIH